MVPILRRPVHQVHRSVPAPRRLLRPARAPAEASAAETDAGQ